MHIKPLFHNKKMKKLGLTVLALGALLSFSPQAIAACTSPAGIAGSIIYNNSENYMQYCDGTGWLHMGADRVTMSQSLVPGGIETTGNTGNTSNLVAHWKLDETSGTTIVDSAGSHNGTPYNGLTISSATASGQVDTSMTFDGVNDGIQVPNSPELENFTAFTLSAWVYPTATDPGGAGRIISKDDTGTADNYGLLYGTSERGRVRIATNGGVQYQIFSDSALPLNAWSHVVGTWDGADLRLYVGGVEASTSPLATSGTLDADGSDLSIGTHLLSGGIRSFPGRLDDIRIYNTDLSASEVLALYNGAAPSGGGVANGLVGHWKLDETSGATVYDVSGSGNHGVWDEGSSGDDEISNDTVTGTIDGALEFDSTKDWITTDLSVGGLPNKTYAGWFYWTADNQWQTMILEGEYFNASKYVGLSITGTDFSRQIGLYQSYGATGSTNLYCLSGYIPPLNQWIHVSATIDKGNDVAKIFINGNLVKTCNDSMDSKTFYDPVNFGVTMSSKGDGGSDLGGIFWGYMDDIRVYDRTLTDTEISEIYDSNIISDLIHHWKLDETSGTTATDSVGSNNGTLSSGLNAGNDFHSGKVSYALEFDGVDDYIATTPVLTNMMGASDDFTTSFWFYGYDITNNFKNRIYSEGQNGPDFISISVRNDSSDVLEIGITDTGNGYGSTSAIGTTALVSNQWYHGAIVKNGTTYTVYLNGSVDGTTSFIHNPAGITNGAIGKLNREAYDTTDYPFDGLIDDFRIYNRALSAVEIQAIHDNENKGLIRHWRLDETTGTTAFDSSQSSDHGTMTGSMTAASETITGKISDAMDFDNDNDLISTTPTVWNRTNYSISAWYKKDNLTDNGIIYAESQSAGGAANGYVTLHSDGTSAGGTNAIDFRVDDDISSNYVFQGPPQTLTIGQWYHVVVTRDNEDYKIYHDGALVDSAVIGRRTHKGIDRGSIGVFHFGGNYGSKKDGGIDDLRLYDYTLSASEVADLYNNTTSSVSGSTPSGIYGPTSGLVAYWPLDETSGTTAVELISGNNGTMTGGLTGADTINAPISTGLDFEDSTNSQRINMGNVLNLPSSAITISAWIKPESVNHPDSILDNFISNQGYRLILADNGGSGGPELAFDIRDASSAFDYIVTYSSPNGSISLGEWQHVTATHDGGANAKLYINGIEKASTSSFSVTRATGSANLYIGYSQNNNSYFDGGIDDVRLYDRVLSPAEVTELYVTTGTNAEVRPFAGTTDGLVGYWKLDETSGTTAIELINNNDGVMTGGLTGADTITGKNKGALQFNGTTDYISVPDTDELNPDAWTLSSWFKVDALSADGTQMIIEKSEDTNASNQRDYSMQFNQPENSLRCYYQSASGVDGITNDVNNSVVVGQWYHGACVYNATNNTLTAYLNGAQLTQKNVAGIIPPKTDGKINIGAAQYKLTPINDEFVGAIDDVRIYNRPLSAAEIAEIYNQECDAGDVQYNTTTNQMQYCNDAHWVGMGKTGNGGGGCTSPTGVAGDMVYNTTHNVMQYCEGDSWVGIGK